MSVTDYNDTKVAAHAERPDTLSGSDTQDETLEEGAQAGVQDIEATTMAWTKFALIMAYISVWIVHFVESMLNGTNGSLLPYVTSSFALHSLTPTVTIISSIIGGVTNLTIAKILDIWGRPQGYMLCLTLGVVGLVMMAACKNVETYAAAMVFFTVGNNGLNYTTSVFVADTTKLKNRGLVQALVNSSVLITTWLAGPISSGFLTGPGWRWCYGMFSIMVPVTALPLFIILCANLRKAKKLGLIPKRNSDRSLAQSFIYYCREFDAVGLILCSAGVGLFLLPFNLFLIQRRHFGSPLIISMLVVGIVLMIAFVIWEKFFAPVTFIPYRLLRDRTAFGACLLAAALFMSYFIWNSYFGSFLQAVKGLSVTRASYVTRAYNIISIVVAIASGWVISKTGRFKPVALYFAMPMTILGQGLLLHFLEPDSKVGYVVMCFVFIAAGQGVIIITDEVAILAATSHEYVAISIAVLGVFSSIGGAIGSTIASAIWQHMMPSRLARYLPADQQKNGLKIYASLATQLKYPLGSPTRLAIQRAYADTFQILLATSVAVWFVGIVGILMWRNIDCRKTKQTKGHVW